MGVPRGVAINVGANTNEPGFRGPIFADGSFEFVPIPESMPTREPVPTYGDLPISMQIPEEVRDVPVHLDPEFAEYGPGERYTYGDPHGVKARPILDLNAGDHVFFYATLDSVGRDSRASWITPGWGAYLIGRFKLARDPIPGSAFETLNGAVRDRFASNAHVKRDPFDAAVMIQGDPDDSRLYESAVPLSGEPGSEPNRVVTELSSDSGAGPWWRRPLRYNAEAVARLLELESGPDTGKSSLG